MSKKRLSLVSILVLLLIPALGAAGQVGAKVSYSVPIPSAGSFPVVLPQQAQQSDGTLSPSHLVHPCGGMFPEPPFTGLSPLSIAHVANRCTGSVYSDPYGDVYAWQDGDHEYVALSGFGYRMFYLINVDDPYNPVLLRTEPFPSGGTAGTSVYVWKQGENHYVSASMRGSGTGCGFFVYNVNDPANPTLVGRKTGTDWCTVHEHIVSTDANGDADYAWLSMSAESGSGNKVVAVDLTYLPIMTETGRYQRPDSNGGSIFVHDVNVVGDRVFVAHWSGGMLVFDKETLAHNNNPQPISPLNGIQPANFRVHHTVPTSDGNHVFIEDEFNNTTTVDKIKMYNISNINSPYFELGLTGTGVAATNRAHNMRILNMSPGHDLLFVGWYQAGTKVFSVDTSVTPPTVTEIASHQLRQTTDGQFGNVWGVDYLPCTLRGEDNLCIYTGDIKYGLVVDALGYNPMLDPYSPESQITDPANGQTINTCSYTIRGTAHDYYSGASEVEVSTDNGATWSLAQGTSNWTYDWVIPSDGTYTIKSRAKDVANNVEVPTTSRTVTVNANCTTASLVGHVIWQGRPAQPNNLQQLPVTITLKSGVSEINYPPMTTDGSGSFNVNVGGLPDGTYNWRVKGSQYLSRSGSVVIDGSPQINLEVGLMTVGDINNDDVINVVDFNMMKQTFGKTAGDPGFDPRADFNGDNAINIVDFNYEKNNFGQTGSPPVRIAR